MITPNPAPEVVFESAPDYAGVTGLWSLPARPSDAVDALLLLSSVSGSRALLLGKPHNSCATGPQRLITTLQSGLHQVLLAFQGAVQAVTTGPLGTRRCSTSR